LRAAVLWAMAVAARDGGFARGRDASGETAREERGLFSVSLLVSGGIVWNGHIGGPRVAKSNIKRAGPKTARLKIRKTTSKHTRCSSL